MKKSKLFFFFWICLLLSGEDIFSQVNHDFCGTYTKPLGLPSNAQGPYYYDRFGNLYDQEELLYYNLPNYRVSGLNSGFFNIIFEGNDITIEEEATVCAVFDYISTSVLCDPPHGVEINILVRKDASVAKPTLATGSPVWSEFDCGLSNSTVMYKIAAGCADEIPPGFEDGIIRLLPFAPTDSEYCYHTIDQDFTCTNPGQQVCDDKYDLFSVVLHEVGHILGIASRINANGTNFTNEPFYSRWDNYINQSGNFILENAPSPMKCCDEKQPNSIIDPASLGNECNSNLYYTVDQTNLVRIAGDGANVPNALSHIRDCPSSDPTGGSYVMTPSLQDERAKRTFTQTEFNILNSLGYDTDPACEAECKVLTCDDFFILNEGDNTVISVTELLSNDVFSTPRIFEENLTCGDVSGLTIDYDDIDEEFNIIANNSGIYEFCYSLFAEDCIDDWCDDATVKIVVIGNAVTECCAGNTSCNINCLGDMESFASEEEMQIALTAGIYPWGNCTFSRFNSVDFYQNQGLYFINCGGPRGVFVAPPQGNQLIGLLSESNGGDLPIRREGVVFPLCESIPNGSQVEVSFLASVGTECLNFNPRVILEFSENPAVSGENVYTNPGINSPTVEVPIQHSTTTNPVFGRYTRVFTNTSGVDWNHLLLSFFYPEAQGFNAAYVLIDDVQVIIDQNTSDIIDVTSASVPSTPCPGGIVSVEYEICNTTNNLSHQLDLTATIPSGLIHIGGGSFSLTTPPSLSIDAGEIPPQDCINLTLLLQVEDDLGLIGSLLDIGMEIDAGDCFESMFETNQVFIIDNPLSITKTLTEHPSGDLEFFIEVCNRYPVQVDNIEVIDNVPQELKITDANPNGEGFDQQVGQQLSRIISLPPGNQSNLTCQILRFFAERDGCICGSVNNCASASILQGGCQSVSNCTSVSGNVSQPIAEFTTEPSPDDCLELKVKPDPNSDPNNPCTTHEWYFGDGSPIKTAVDPTHTYPTDGTYVITHTVTNDCGTDVYELTVDISCSTGEFVCPCTTTGSLNLLAVDPDDPDAGVSVSTIAGLPSLTIDLRDYGGCMAIAGKLIVDEDFYVHHGEMRMQPGAEIVVRGAELKIEHTKGFGDPANDFEGIHGCEKMWRGITVTEQPNSSLYFSGNHIQDAEYALRIRERNGASSQVNIFKSNFIDNHVGIYADGNGGLFPQRTRNTSMSIRLNWFGRSDLSHRLLNPFDPDIFGNISVAGIKAEYAVFDVGSSFGFDNFYYNTFEKMNNGIIAKNSIINVWRNEFKNLHIIGFPNGENQPNGVAVYGEERSIMSDISNNFIHDLPRGILGGGHATIGAGFNTIENVDVGIASYNTGLFFNVNDNTVRYSDVGVGIYDPVHALAFEINDNDFYDTDFYYAGAGFLGKLPNRTAIYLRNIFGSSQEDSRVDRNNIFQSAVPFGSSSAPNDLYQGVHTDEGANISFTNNFVDAQNDNQGIGFNISTLRNSGFYDNDFISITAMQGMEMYGATGNTYCCNTFSNTGGGGMSFTGTAAGSTIRQNVFQQGVHYGILCAQGTTLSIQPFGGNKWYNSCPTGVPCSDAAHFGNKDEREDSQFWTEDCGMPLWPSIIFPSQGCDITVVDEWFRLSNFGVSPADCAADAAFCSPPGFPPPGGEEGENGYPLYGITSSDIIASEGGFRDMLNWEVQRGLYEKLTKQSSLLEENVSVDSFYYANLNSGVSEFYEVERQRDEALSFTASERQSLNELYSNMKAEVEELKAINALMEEAETPEDSIALVAQRQAVHENLVNQSQVFQSVLDDFDTRRTASLATVEQLNDAIAATTLLEQNLKTVNAIYLETVARGITELTEAQAEQILPIAGQCYIEGGNAVFRARQLYNMYESTEFDDDIICGGGEARIGVSNQLEENKINNYGLEIHPNPARDVLFIDFGKVSEAETSAIVEIIDLTGRVLLEKEIDLLDGHTSTELNLEKVPAGATICKVRFGSGNETTEKIVTLK